MLSASCATQGGTMTIRRVAVMTSGGDAPGMNAAIRGVVRAGLYNGWEMFGIREGFAGLMAGDYRPLGARDVGGIIQLGGTMLGSARARSSRRRKDKHRPSPDCRRPGSTRSR